MRTVTLARTVILLAVGLLSACASVPGSALRPPEVRLSNVEVVGLGFERQTFLLSFDVSNPNPMSLPVRHLAYGLKLDGMRFASGETNCDVIIPANGDTSFAISVELDLLQTAPQLLFRVRDGSRQDIAYELEGRMGIDLPLVPALRYRNHGNLRLGAGAH